MNKQISRIEIAIYIVLFMGAGFYMYNASSSNPTSGPSFSKQEKIYETIFPQISKTFSTQKLIGKVSSNNFAMIHPRREGIIRDILVDVGDEVKVGQTIAYLFPPGVEGEGASQIAKAKAELLTAQEELKNARAVEAESVEVSEKKLSQTQINLGNVMGGNTRSQLIQNYEQAENIAFQAFRNIEWMLFGESNAIRSVSSLVGDFNNRIQENKVFNLFQETQHLKDEYSKLIVQEKQEQIYKLLEQIESLLAETEILYRDAEEGTAHSSNTIEKHTKDIQALQTKILNAQKMIDDTFLAVDQLAVGVETAQKSLSLVQSQARKTIDQAAHKVEVAQAVYQNILVKNGHVQVTSPFSGKISAKFVEVGHMAMPSLALFEILEVDTSLGQVAPLEVEFGVPEEFLTSVAVGDQISIETSSHGTSKIIKATINRKSSQINQASNTAVVYAILDEKIMLPHNSNVYVHIQDTKNPVYEIPSYSIKKRRNQNFIFIQYIEDEVPKPRYQKIEVHILAEDGEYSDVTGGITLDSAIVANPSVTLFHQAQDDKPVN